MNIEGALFNLPNLSRAKNLKYHEVFLDKCLFMYRIRLSYLLILDKDFDQPYNNNNLVLLLKLDVLKSQSFKIRQIGIILMF